MNEFRFSKYLWMGLYVASIFLANVTLNHFIELGVLGSLSVGTLFFGAVFTLRDKLHEFGLPTVYISIVLALLINNMAAAYYDTPPRFLFASFFSILVGELADTAVYQRFINKAWLTRALSSNAISIPLDTVLFAFLAFYGQNSDFEFLHEGALSFYEIMRIIWADLLFKAFVATVLVFVIYKIKKKHL